MAKMAYEVNESDLTQAKTAMKSSLLNSHATSNGVCEELGRHLLVYGRRIPRDEMFARIDAVDASAVKRVASKVIQDQDLAISAVGELSFLPDYTWFRRRTFWNRY
jgi:processing peptidase subunit beta